MSEQLNQNTIDLQTILNLVNSLPDEGSGLDTSDATATANDIASGKTAYVDGVKITGNLPESGYLMVDEVDGMQVKNKELFVFNQDTGRQIVNGLYCLVDATPLGNATAADVVKGKTFTSVNGMALTGTYEGSSGGGLPSGVSALASGTYTPAENKTSRVDISHGLGVTPNFLVVIMEEDTSSAPLTSTLVGATAFFKSMKYNSSSTIQYTAHVSTEGYSSSSIAGGSASRFASPAYFTTTTVGIPCTSNYNLKVGYTYRWVCGVMDGIN